VNQTRPAGSEVVRAPCDRQNEHWQDRTRQSFGATDVEYVKRISPQ
jgi:hypothetical protein